MPYFKELIATVHIRTGCFLLLLLCKVYISIFCITVKACMAIIESIANRAEATTMTEPFTVLIGVRGSFFSRWSPVGMIRTLLFEHSMRALVCVLSHFWPLCVIFF